jgi:hypothetical protein
MNDFTKEELQYFLMIMKPFHWLCQYDPMNLENKIQSMINNYCEHEKSGIEHIECMEICKKCNKPY